MDWQSFLWGLLALPAIPAAGAILVGIPWLACGVIALLAPNYKVDRRDGRLGRARWVTWVVSRRIWLWGPHGSVVLAVAHRRTRKTPIDSELERDILRALDAHEEREKRRHDDEAKRKVAERRDSGRVGS